MRPLRASLLILALISAGARADSSGWGIRLGAEAPFTTHTNAPPPGQARTLTIGDAFQPSLDLLVEQAPASTLSFGFEGRLNFESTNGYAGTGTSVGPEMTLNVPVIPFYARVALPVRVAPHIGDLGLRVAAGLKLSFSSLGVYMEGAADAPLFGVDVGGRNEKPIGRQTISIGAGLELRF